MNSVWQTNNQYYNTILPIGMTRQILAIEEEEKEREEFIKKRNASSSFY